MPIVPGEFEFNPIKKTGKWMADQLGLLLYDTWLILNIT